MPFRPVARPWPALLAAAAVAALAGWQARLLARAFDRGHALADTSRAFETRPHGARTRVLVLGDSTGVGVGAGSAGESVAGLLARRFPRTEVVNRAVNGARLRDLADQVEKAAGHLGRFDLVLLFVGGNDVLRHTPRAQVLAQARRLLRALRGVARRTVWLGCGDIGTSPALVPPLSWWMSRRTTATMQLLAREAAAHGVEFIDFSRGHGWHPPPPALVFAVDGVHPSSHTYGRCFAALVRRAPLAALDPKPVAAA